MFDAFKITAACGAAVFILLMGCSRDIEKPPVRPAAQQAGAQPKVPQQTAAQQAGPQGQENLQRELDRNDPARKKRTLTLNENKKREERAAGTAAEKPAQPLFEGRESLLHENIHRRIMPEDFLIGKLQDDYHPDQELKIILERAALFFNALMENKVEPAYLHPDWKKLITRSLAVPTEEYSGFNSYRLGEIAAGDTRARLNIRLLSAVGRSEGEVFLEKEEGIWYISDIQIDLTKLLVEYEPEGEFEPSTYRWLELY